MYIYIHTSCINNVFFCIHTYMYTYIYIFTNTCDYIYIYIYIHTYIYGLVWNANPCEQKILVGNR